MSRFRFYLAVLFLPTWRWFIVFPVWVIGVGTRVRDEVLDEKLRQKYQTHEILEAALGIFPWWGWVFIGFGLLIIIVLQSTFRIHLKDGDGSSFAFREGIINPTIDTTERGVRGWVHGEERWSRLSEQRCPV